MWRSYCIFVFVYFLLYDVSSVDRSCHSPWLLLLPQGTQSLFLICPFSFLGFLIFAGSLKENLGKFYLSVPPVKAEMVSYLPFVFSFLTKLIDIHVLLSETHLHRLCYEVSFSIFYFFAPVKVELIKDLSHFFLPRYPPLSKDQCIEIYLCKNTFHFLCCEYFCHMS